jgi:3,5-dioxohexanoate:acetyl-CoA acetone transferase
VGQEDNLFDRPGVPFASNAAQVERLKSVLPGFNIEIADIAEARARLGLGG